MLNVLVLVVGAVAGFVMSRRLRRPDRAAQAASVARNVSGTLGRRRGLTPPELQRACFSEMVRHVQVNRQGRTHAPSRYVIHLHDDDLSVVDESRRWFTEGLVGALRQAAEENGWMLEGAVQIDFEADGARRPGVPTALAVAPEQPRGSRPSAPPPAAAAEAPTAPRSAHPRTLVVVRSDTGEQVALGSKALSIGRSRERDITIDDNRVSRAHARIIPRQGGWFLVDDGSANGTTVGGTALVANTPHRLRSGEVVLIGPVELRIVAGSGPRSEPGTRALDDNDRHRISRDVLPPGGDR